VRVADHGKDRYSDRESPWFTPGALERLGRPKCWYRDVSNADKAAEDAGAGVNVWLSDWRALWIALEGAGAAS
jgi:hypothetical protein